MFGLDAVLVMLLYLTWIYTYSLYLSKMKPQLNDTNAIKWTSLHGRRVGHVCLMDKEFGEVSFGLSWIMFGLVKVIFRLVCLD